jgi:hypothetical protein
MFVNHFRDMASIVSEAEAAITNRFEVLEPKIYNSKARQVPNSPEWFMSASSKIKVIAKNMTRVALVAEESTKYLAKAYNLSREDVTFALPLSDVRGTRLSTLCQIKVDFPCQPGKYRAYNGYCNNVQNPNWGVANRRYCQLLVDKSQLPCCLFTKVSCLFTKVKTMCTVSFCQLLLTFRTGLVTFLTHLCTLFL